MADIVDRLTRSRMMAGIRSTNTKPELTIRRGLHGLGLRYRLHSKNVPGKPDIVFRSRKAVVFIHGCFWHGHDCSFYRKPKTRSKFWENKVRANRKRDATVSRALCDDGWRQLTIWECAIRGKDTETINDVIKRAEKWIRSDSQNLVLRGE